MKASEASARSVDMGELAVARAPDVLEIRGLGSCIALALHDPLQRLAGLAHVVIPRPLPNAAPAPAWTATEAVPRLVEAMEAQGARAGRLTARLAGGSAMFADVVKGYEVGRANAEAVERLLRERGIPVLSRQVGGQASRTVRLHAEDGRFEVQARHVPSRRPAAQAGARRDDGETSRLLLEAAVAPLSKVLQRPVAVESADRYDLTVDGLEPFLGARTALWWSRLAFADGARQGAVEVVLPEEHAARVDDELRARASQPAEPGEAIEEVMGMMGTHVLTTLARLRGARLQPLRIEVSRGRTPRFLAGRDGREAVIVAHGQLHVEGALRGVDVAVVTGRA